MPVSLDQFLKASEVSENSWWPRFKEEKLPSIIARIDEDILSAAKVHKPGTAIKVKVTYIPGRRGWPSDILDEFIVKEVKKKDSPLRLELEGLYPDWKFSAHWSQSYEYSGWEERGEGASLVTHKSITLTPKGQDSE